MRGSSQPTRRRRWGPRVRGRCACSQEGASQLPGENRNVFGGAGDQFPCWELGYPARILLTDSQ